MMKIIIFIPAQSFQFYQTFCLLLFIVYNQLFTFDFNMKGKFKKSVSVKLFTNNMIYGK